MNRIILVVTVLLSTLGFSQVGVGTDVPEANAILDLTATDKALLLPRVANIDAIATPVNGMMIYSVNQKCFKSYENEVWVDLSTCQSILGAMTFQTVTYQGVSVINTTGIGYNGETVDAASTITVNVAVTEPTSYVFTATHPATGLVYSATGSFAAAGTFPVVLQNNGALIPWDTYGILNMTLSGASNTINLAPRIDIKSIPASQTAVVDVTYGTQTWMDRNLGARRVATAIDDVLSYGNHYQWGRPADGHEITVWNGTALNQGRGFYDPTAVGALATTDSPEHPNFILTNASPNDWRSNNNNNRWATASQGPCPTGYRVPTLANWNTADNFGSWNNNTHTFSSALKLPSSGFRGRSNNLLDSQGTGGDYWTSSVSTTNASSFFFFSTKAEAGTNNRAFGFTVRCIKN